MEQRPKLTKEMICEEARFILANVLAEGRYGKQNRLDDIRRICEGAVSLSLLDYVGFLENFGYLTYDRRSDVLDVTPDGERVVSGEKTQDLIARVVQHFFQRASGGTGSGSASRRSRFLQGAGSAPAAAPPAAPPPSEIAEPPTSVAPVAIDRVREILDRRYEKLERIGSGGIGTVWRARQINLDRDVAVKEVRELFSFFNEEQRREIVRRFGDVARQASRLAHPNILPIYDINVDREHPYWVTELAPHGNLRRIIQLAEEIPVTLAVRYFLHTLHALRAAHDQGVFHRGLKPENILLDRFGNARVGDFGTARLVERDQAIIQQVYVGMGAMAYMAPELYSDPLGAGPQTDLYALGIILYELLTRRIPGRRSPMPSDVVKGLPKAMDEIFDRLTRDVREERYQTAEEALDEFYRAESITTLADLKGSLLFFKSPLETLRFREAPPASASGTPVPPPAAGASAPAPGQGSAVSAPAAPVDLADPGAAEPPVQASLPPAPLGEIPKAERESTGRLSRRPYSFQQRLKDRDKGD